MSGLDEQTKMIPCPKCGSLRGYFISNKHGSFQGLLRKMWFYRDFDGNRLSERKELLAINLNILAFGYHNDTIKAGLESGAIENFERYRCSNCRTLFSKWKSNTSTHDEIQLLVSNLIKRRQIVLQNFHRYTEPRYRW